MTGQYNINVVNCEPMKIVGLKVRTNMATSADDCPQLWGASFGPRMKEVASFPAPSYGVSTMVDEVNFDYWAAMPWREGDPIPAGMEVMELPGGFYAECHLESLKDLAMAYQYMFSVWPQLQSGYEYYDAPSYELYPQDYAETGRLSLYMAVKKKA